MTELQEIQKRFEWIDPLRVLAAFGVMLAHIAARDWHELDVTGAAWQICNFYDSLGHSSMRCFVMISGAIFLSRPLDIKKLYSKNLLRIATAFSCWSLYYAYFGISQSKPVIERIITGATHLWYCYAIAGVYILMPLLKRISEDSRLTDYYLKIAFVFKFLLTTFALLLGLFGCTKAASTGIRTAAGYFYTGAPFALAFYFMLGYRLAHTDFPKKTRRLIYLAGIIGVFSTIFLTSYASVSAGKPIASFYGGFTLNTLFVATALFVFAKYNLKSGKFIRKLSDCTFGAYLVHAAFDIQFHRMGIVMDRCPLLLIPAIALAVFVCSFAASALLNRIPCVKKYIV